MQLNFDPKNAGNALSQDQESRRTFVVLHLTPQDAADLMPVLYENGDPSCLAIIPILEGQLLEHGYTQNKNVWADRRTPCVYHIQAYRSLLGVNVTPELDGSLLDKYQRMHVKAFSRPDKRPTHQGRFVAMWDIFITACSTSQAVDLAFANLDYNDWVDGKEWDVDIEAPAWRTY
jgi:hypothetical protein